MLRVGQIDPRGCHSRRAFLVGGLMVFAGAAMAACSSAATPTPAPVPTQASASATSVPATSASASSASATSAPAPAAAGPTVAAAKTVSYWNDYTGGNGPPMNAMLASFTKATGITVQQQQFNYPDLSAKMRVAAQSGDNPDVAMVLTIGVWGMAQDGILDVMDPADATAHGFNGADYADVSWNAPMYKGKRYGIPLDFVEYVLYLNTAMFKSAGMLGSDGKPTAPTGKDDLMQMAQKLTQGGSYGLSLGTPGLAWTYETFLFQNGGNFFNSDFTKAAIAQPESLEVATLWSQVFTKLKTSPPVGFDGVKAFIGGKLAMMQEGSWAWPVIEAAKIDYLVAPVPTLFKSPKVWGIGHNFTLPKQKGRAADRREAGWQLMRYLTDNALTWSLTGGVLGATKKVQENSQILAHPMLGVASKQVPNVEFAQPTPLYESAENKAGPIFEAIYSGKTPPNDALTKLAAEIDAMMK